MNEWNAKTIENFRKSQGWSQAEMGAKVGVSKNMVWYWESGRKKPGIDSILRLDELEKSVGRYNKVSVGPTDQNLTEKSNRLTENLTDETKKSNRKERNHAEGEQRARTAHENLTDNNENLTEKSNRNLKNLTESLTADGKNLTADGENHAEGEQRARIKAESARSLPPAHESLTASDRVDVTGDPVQAYYETMYEDAKGVISLCTITQPKDSAKGSSLQVKGFYEISRIPDLIAEANKLNGRFHIYTGIHRNSSYKEI